MYDLYIQHETPISSKVKIIQRIAVFKIVISFLGDYKTDDLSPQMTILNTVIPILMHLCLFSI